MIRQALAVGVAAIAVAYLAICGLLYLSQRSYLYCPVSRGGGGPSFVMHRGDAEVVVSTGGADGAGERDGAELGAAVLALAAEIFLVEPDVLTGQSRVGDVPGWDSFSQLSFVLAVEQEFAIAIPAARIASIASIGDMVRTIEELRR